MGLQGEQGRAVPCEDHSFSTCSSACFPTRPKSGYTQVNCYKLNSLSLFWLAKIVHPGAFSGSTASDVNFVPRVLSLPTSLFLRFVLLTVSEESKTWLQFFPAQCIIKQLLDSVFVISRIVMVRPHTWHTYSTFLVSRCTIFQILRAFLQTMTSPRWRVVHDL